MVLVDGTSHTVSGCDRAGPQHGSHFLCRWHAGQEERSRAKPKLFAPHRSRAAGWSARASRRARRLPVPDRALSYFIPSQTGIGFDGSSSLVPGRSPADLLLALALVAVVAISEETIFRGYLLLRFRSVFGSTWPALLIASVIFMLGHGYEGGAGALTVGVTGAVCGAVYLWRRSLVAPVTMHFLLDAIAIILAPLLLG